MTIKYKLKNIFKSINHKEEKSTSKVVYCKKCMCPLFKDEIMCPDCLTQK